ncbi:MAG: glycosyltransferase family 2 protein [Candidatus Eisenbacteria bacterium]|nr:glycosyltransferase family 2 protein [Candidatus Eisenbacteria bacterium]
MRTLILVPAYRLEGTIGPVLEETRRAAPGREILVVDDGSDDATGREAGAVEGVRVVAHSGNRGKGAALRTGFAEAIREGFDAVLTLDGDGQHPPELIPLFEERLTAEGADLVIGSRWEDFEGMPRMRRLSNRLCTWAVSRAVGRNLPDSQSGYRLVRTRVLEAVPLRTSHYETETELLIGAARRGFRITSIPIPARYGVEKSHIRVWRDMGRFLRLLVTLRNG